MSDRGILIVVSGFSGSGKGTLMKELLKRYPDIYAPSISATTRAPREGEEDGREYFFISKDEFEKMIAKDELIEYARYVENYYGTPRRYVEEKMKQGKDVILEIEIQGALKVKKRFPDALLLFVTPPSAEELCRRLALPEELKLLLFVGRLEAYKRPFAALELLERLGGQYGLVVIGDGSLSERFQETAAEKGLLDRFFYFRRVPNVEMYRYYAACDYFVNFNTHEIFGMSILEAMYQGCVVAARRAPGPEQIIEDGVSGFLCSSDQEMDLVFSDPRTERMGEAAEKRIQDCFTWDRTAEQIRAQVLKQLTGRQRAEEGKE